MSEFRHFFVASSTHPLFFAVDGITSDIRHATKEGRRSDTPWCRLFDSFLFQSVNQNLHKPSKIRHPPTLKGSAFRRVEVSDAWRCHQCFYPESVEFFDSYQHMKRRSSDGMKCRSDGTTVGRSIQSVGWSSPSCVGCFTEASKHHQKSDTCW